MAEKTILCESCKQEFVWTEGEQEFYRQKGLMAPRLCLICRAREKARLRDEAKYKK